MLEAIQRSTNFLAKRGVESPRLQSELILAHVLRVPRLNLYLNFERQLESGALDAARNLIQRRGDREPVQQILESVSFCGIDLRVTRDVLIPRPETELLAERGWEWLAQAATTSNAPLALDFGTGSGCLAIALALRCPTARLIAVDISVAALEIARANARTHAVEDRIELVAGDGFDVLQTRRGLDLLVANPPYIASAAIDGLAPEVARHEPRVALDGGADGLDYFRRLAQAAAPAMSASSRLLLEIGDDQSAAVVALLERENWVVHEVGRDYSGRERMVIAGRRNS